MKPIIIILELVVLGVVLWVIFDAVVRYRAATGTTMERLLAVGQGSMTIVLQRLTYLFAGMAELLPVLAESLGAPGVADAIKTVVPAGAGPYYALGFAFLTEMARRRTLPPG